MNRFVYHLFILNPIVIMLFLGVIKMKEIFILPLEYNRKAIMCTIVEVVRRYMVHGMTL